MTYHYPYEGEHLAHFTKLGHRNSWVREADDPPFSESCFGEVDDAGELYDKLTGSCWCVGSAFVYKNLAFINQATGGEWLVCRADTPKAFESYTVDWMEKEKFLECVERLLKATPEQLMRLEY